MIHVHPGTEAFFITCTTLCLHGNMLRQFCLCVKRMLCIKTAKRFIKILLPPDRPIILVFHHQGSLLNCDASPWSAEYKGVRK